jgi:hypothetical protein
MMLKSLTRRIDPRPPTPAVLATEPSSGGDWARLRRHAAMRLEESLDHVPTVLRRLGLFLLIGSIAMVAFAVAVVVVLIHAVA